MMRSFLYITTASAVIALAYWAYTENIKTQAAITHTEQLQFEIGKQRARLAILKADRDGLTNLAHGRIATGRKTSLKYRKCRMPLQP